MTYAPTSRLMPQFLPVDSAPAARDGDAPLDVIFINGFVGETVIGIHEDELHRTQPLRIDLAAGLPRALACDTDRIGDTIDYGEVRSALRDMLQDHAYQLLEAFAEGVANLLLGRFGAHWVRVGITKPRKFDDVDGVGVLIERRRAHRAPVEPRRDAEVLSLLASGMVPGNRLR